MHNSFLDIEKHFFDNKKMVTQSTQQFKKLGKLFKSNREKNGITQRQASERLGYSSPQFVSNFERGLCALPLKKIKVLIELYEMDANNVANIIIDFQAKMIRKNLMVSKSA